MRAIERIKEAVRTRAVLWPLPLLAVYDERASLAEMRSETLAYGLERATDALQLAYSDLEGVHGEEPEDAQRLGTVLDRLASAVDDAEELYAITMGAPESEHGRPGLEHQQEADEPPAPTPLRPMSEPERPGGSAA